MQKKSTNKTQTSKVVNKKGAEDKSTTKVDTIIDSKVAAIKKVEKVEVAATEIKKESPKENTKVSANTERSKKTTSKAKAKETKKAKTKETTKVKSEIKTTNKEETKINYVELLGDAPVKVIISNEKNTGKTFPIKVALKNFGFLKTVKVRYTEDNWVTPQEKELIFNVLDENNIEEWSTEIEINSKNKTNLQYAISYQVNDQIYWDNNNGSNYIANI